MYNILLAAFVSLFFVRRTTTDTKERIRTASKWRTLLYGFLTIIVAVLYYKTCQVAVINNIIQIEALRASYDSTGVIADWIDEVEIFNRISSMGIYKDEIVNKLGESDEDIKNFNENGGVRINLISQNSSKYEIKQKPDPDLHDYDIVKMIPENVSCKHLYNVIFIANSIPSLWPFFPRINETSNFRFLGNAFHQNNIISSRDEEIAYLSNQERVKYKSEKSRDTLPLKLDNGFIFSRLFGTFGLDSIKEKPIVHELFTYAKFVNSMNFFTAADLTQISYRLHISSDLPLNSVYIEYNLPIETKELMDSMAVGTRGIHIRGKMIKALQDDTVEMHIKLPALENLQLIRSLIFTTILTAIIALFLNNLYYLICSYAKKIRKKHTIPYSKAKLLQKERRTIFISFLKFIAFVGGALLLYLTSLLILEKPILIDKEDETMYILLLVAIAIFISYMIYRLYRYMRTPVYPQENDNEPATIFYHDDIIKDIEEEFDIDSEEEFNVDSNNEDDEKSNI